MTNTTVESLGATQNDFKPEMESLIPSVYIHLVKIHSLILVLIYCHLIYSVQVREKFPELGDQTQTVAFKYPYMLYPHVNLDQGHIICSTCCLYHLVNSTSVVLLHSCIVVSSPTVLHGIVTTLLKIYAFTYKIPTVLKEYHRSVGTAVNSCII